MMEEIYRDRPIDPGGPEIEKYRDEGGRQVAGPVLRDRALAAEEHRQVKRLVFWLAVGLVAAFTLGALLGWSIRGDIAMQVSRKAPCTVQVLGTEGTKEGLDTLENDAQAASAAVGADLEILRGDDYVVLVAELCKEDTADRMDQS